MDAGSVSPRRPSFIAVPSGRALDASEDGPARGFARKTGLTAACAGDQDADGGPFRAERDAM